MLYYCKQNNIGLLIKICKTLTPIFVCKTLEEEMEDKKDIKIGETENDEAEIAAAPIGPLGDKLKSKIKGSTLKTNFDDNNYMVSQEIDTTKIGTKTNQSFSVLDAGPQEGLPEDEVVLAFVDQPTQDYNDAYFVKNQEGQYFVYISDELRNTLLKNNSGFEFPQSLETRYNNFSKYPIEKMKLSSSLQLEEIKISGAGTDIAMMFSALGCQVKNAEGKIAKLRCEDHFDITVSTNLLKECFTAGSKCEFDKVEPAYSSTLIALTQLERHKNITNSKGKETADDICLKLPSEENYEVELHSLKVINADGSEQYLNLKIEDGKTYAYLQTTNEATQKNYRTARYYEIDSAHLEAANPDLTDSMMYIGLREKGSGKGNNVTRVNLDIDFNLNKPLIKKMQDILGRKFGEKAEGTENVSPITTLDVDGRKQNIYNRSLDKFATINALNTVAGLSKTIDESKDFTNPNVPLDKAPENNIPPINNGGDKEGIISGGLNPEQPNQTNPTNPTDPEPPVNPVNPTDPEDPENPPETPEQPVEPQQPDPEVQNPEQPAPENQAPEKPDDGKDKDKPADKGEKKDEGNKDKKKEKKPWDMKGLHLFNDIFGVSSSTVGILLAIIGGVILNPALYGVGLMLLALSPLSAIAGSVVEAIGELTKGAEKKDKPESMKKKEFERSKDRYRLKDLQNDITMTYSEKYEVAQNRIMHITQKRQELLNRNAEISKNALVSEYDQLSSLETLDDAQKKRLKQLKKDKTVKELLNERTENEKSVKELQQLADDFRSYAYEVRLETMSIPERLKEVQEIKNSLNDYTKNAVGTSELMRNIGKLETPALGAFVKEYNKYETKINDLNTTQQQLNKVFAKEYNIDVEDYKQQVLKSASSLDENGVVSNPAYPKEIVDTIMDTRYFSTDEKYNLINGLKDQNAAEQNKITEEIMQLNDEVFALEENKEFKELSLKRDQLLTVAQKSKNEADKAEAMKQVQEIETNPVYAENVAKIEEKNNIINQKQEISDTLSANDKKYTKILTEQAKTLQEIMAESYDICQKLAAANENEKPFDVVTTIKSLNKFENADKAVIAESVSSFLKDENNKVFDQKIKICRENPDKYLTMNSVKRLKSTDEYQEARAKFEKDKDLQSNMKLLEFYEQQEKDLIAQLPAEKQAEVAPVEIYRPFDRTEIIATNIEETEKEISAEEEALQILQSNNPDLTLEDVGFNLNEGEVKETPVTPVEEEKPAKTAEVTEETQAQEVEQPVETPAEQPKEELKEEKAEPEKAEEVAQEQEKPAETPITIVEDEKKTEVIEEKPVEKTEEKAEEKVEEAKKPSKGKKTAQKEQKPENDAEQLTIEGYENIPVEKPAKKRGRPRKVQKDGELKNITLEEADKQEEAQKEVAPAEKAEEKKEKELPKEEQKTEKEVVDQKGKKGKIEKVSLEEIGETKAEKAAREAREKEEAEKLEMQQILESNTEFERKKSFFGKLTSKSKKTEKSSKSSNSGRGM